MDLSGLQIVLFGQQSRHRQYRYEVLMLVRQVTPTPNPFIEVRYNFTNIADLMHMLTRPQQQQQRQQQQQQQQQQIVEIELPRRRHIQIETPEFLPRNFAHHNENVMTNTVVKSLKETIDFLICKVEYDPYCDTLAEIRIAFDEHVTFFEIIQKWFPFILFLITCCLSTGTYFINQEYFGPAVLLNFIVAIVCNAFGRPDRIMNHMRTLYNHTDNSYYMHYGVDLTYKQLLNLLWVYIRSHKYRKELLHRLRQEVSDSLHVCYHGNMVRLANVLQGFEPDLHPPISGEIVQITISRIASLDVSVDEKVQMATDSLIEFGMPEAERESWIMAIRDV